MHDAGRRMTELDGLRGLAVAAVVAFHFWPAAVPWGHLSVVLFFVLSGYLISSIVLEHGGGPGFLRTFYTRRVLRIWPAYYVALLALVACGAGPPRGLWYFVTYLQDTPLYLTLRPPLWTSPPTGESSATPGPWPSRSSSTCSGRPLCSSSAPGARRGWRVPARRWPSSAVGAGSAATRC